MHFRLFDRRALSTCSPNRTCSDNLLLVGTTSFTSLAVNPANPHQFCVSHGPYLGEFVVCCVNSLTSHDSSEKLNRVKNSIRCPPGIIIRVVATTPEKTHNQKFLTFETIFNRFFVQF